jgi:signal peptidase I
MMEEQCMDEARARKFASRAGLEGNKAMLFRLSGNSMSPTLQHSDLLSIESCGKPLINSGDVIAFRLPGRKGYIVHRVVDVSLEGYLTRGDGNREADPWVVKPEQVAGRAVVAWRGMRKRRVASGIMGHMAAWIATTRKRIDQALSPRLHPIYQALARQRILYRLLPVSHRPRVIAFSGKAGAALRLMMGRKTIGHFDEGKDEWVIKRPFRLFVDDRLLPRPVGGQGAGQLLRSSRVGEPSPKMGAGHGPWREMTLILQCLRNAPREDAHRQIRDLLQAGIDWRSVLLLARRHKVVPLLYRGLHGALGAEMPEDVARELRRSYQMNAARNERLLQQLLDILRCFRAHALPAIALRGPVSAELLYGDLAMRQCSDLDILVEAQHVPHAARLLQGMGYRPLFNLTPAQQADCLRREGSRYNFGFWHPEHQAQVELHWRFAPHYFAFDPDYEALWQHRSYVRCRQQGVAALAPLDALLVGCVHGAKHFWSQLGWVCDVAQFVRKHEALDWACVMEEAAAVGCRRMVLLGLYLARSLLDAPIPLIVQSALQADAEVRALGQLLVRERLLPMRPAAHPLFEEALLHLRFRERFADRLRYLWRLGLTPNEADWAAFRLPKMLSPFNIILRPLRLAIVHVLQPAIRQSTPRRKKPRFSDRSCPST